jgi:hypothetical protein
MMSVTDGGRTRIVVLWRVGVRQRLNAHMEWEILYEYALLKLQVTVQLNTI